jgi:sulfate/thiosulfate transport system substrate-binding protein
VDASIERHKNRPLAEAFLAFLRSKEGQAILGEYGFRRLDEATPPGTFTMADLGGWSKVKAEVYGPKGLWTSIFTDREKARRGGSR